MADPTNTDPKNTLKSIYISNDNVQHNILDEYESYTYNLTFSMMPMSFYYSGNFTLGSQARKDAKRVIIAQTGVTTKFNIDNLTIESVTDNYGSTFTSSLTYSTQATFQILEPQGSSLIHLMHMGYNKLKEIDEANGNTFEKLYGDSKNKGPLDLPYLLEVDLIGHKPIGEQYDEQEFNVIGKYVYPCYLTNFDFNPQTEGTQYNFRLVSIHNIGATLIPETRRLAKEVTIKGKDTTELLKDLEGQVNRDIVQRLHIADTDSADAQQRSHVIKIDLGSKYEEDKKMEQELDDKGKPKWHAAVLPIDPGKLTPVTDAVGSSEQADNDGTGSKEETKLHHVMTLKKGRSIKACITDILGLNHKFCSLVTDREFTNEESDIGKPKDPKADIFSPKIQMAPVAKAGGYTVTTGGPAYNIAYTIDLLKQAGVQTGSQKVLTEEEKSKALIDRWGIVKKYDYMFTGLNDQIQDVDITFPTGQVFLFPEYGGMSPTYKDAPAQARSLKEIASGKKKTTNRLTKGAFDAESVLAHFETLGNDLRDIVTGARTDAVDFIEGLAAMRPGVAANLRSGNKRLPASPQAVFAKGKAITQATQTIDKLFTDIQDLQKAVESAAGELASGINGGVNLLTKKIGKIVTESMTPFNFKSSLGSAIGNVRDGIGGLVDNINDATGLTLNANDIPGLGEFDNILSDIEDVANSTIPDGFGTPGTNPDLFGALTYDTTSVDQNQYLEEFDFSTDVLYSGESESIGLPGQANSGDELSQDTTPKQHYTTTALSYGKTGIPYLARLTLDVKGDPYWLGRRNFASEYQAGIDGDPITESLMRKGGGWKPEFLTSRTEIDGAPYDAGSVFLAFRYVFPKEYETYQDDINEHSGKIEMTTIDMSYTGYYMVVKVTNKFIGGLFTQQLESVKMNTAPNKAVFVDGKEVAGPNINKEGNSLSDDMLDALVDT